MKNCPFCGLSNQDYARFCIHCGRALPFEAEAPSAATQAGSPQAAVEANRPSTPYAAPQGPATSYAPKAPPYSPSPVTPRPSPYASLPHIPESAKRKNPENRRSALGGILLVVGFIAVVMVVFFIGSRPNRSPARPASSLIPPGHYSPQPSRADSPYTYRLGGDATISMGWESGMYLLKGTIYIDSDAKFSKANITISVYMGDTFITSDTETMGVHNNKIEYVMQVHMTTYEALEADGIRVRINDIY